MVCFNERIYTREYWSYIKCVSVCLLVMGWCHIRLKCLKTISKATKKRSVEMYVIHRNSLLPPKIDFIRMVQRLTENRAEMLLNVTVHKKVLRFTYSIFYVFRIVQAFSWSHTVKKSAANDHFRKFTSRGFTSPSRLFVFFCSLISIQLYPLERNMKKPYASWTNYRMPCAKRNIASKSALKRARSGNHLFLHTF